MNKLLVNKNLAFALLGILSVAYLFLFPPGILLFIPLFFTGYYATDRGLPIFTIFVALSFAWNIIMIIFAVSSYILDFHVSKQTDLIFRFLLFGLPIVGALATALMSQFTKSVVAESPINFFDKVKLFAKTYPFISSILVMLSLATFFILYDRIQMMLYYARY